MPYRHNTDSDSSDSDDGSPVPMARDTRPTYKGRRPRDWSKTTMPPSRPPKKDPTFDPSRYEFEFEPYNTSLTPLGYEGLLDMFPRPNDDDDDNGIRHIKRVSNMFFVFRTHFTKTYKNVLDPRTGRPRHPVPEKDISRMAAWVWNFRMTPAERRPYFDTYLQLKHEHEQDHPDYKYQPTRPEEAERIRAEKAKQRAEELEKQKAESAARKEKDEQERKKAKISKKKWAAMKREQKRREEEGALPEFRLRAPSGAGFASASPFGTVSTPPRPPSASPIGSALGWNGLHSRTPSRQGTPGLRQAIELPRLLGTPARQTPRLPQIITDVTAGLGLQFPGAGAVEPTYADRQPFAPFHGLPPFSATAHTPSSANPNMLSPFQDVSWRPIAALPNRAHNVEHVSPVFADHEEPTAPPQYQHNFAPVPYTPPRTAATKRVRVNTPANNPVWQLTPVTPSPMSSLAKQRMLWGVSPQTEKVDRSLEFSARRSPAPEEQDVARSIVSPRQAHHRSLEEVASSTAHARKRRVSATGQGGRSRTPSYIDVSQAAVIDTELAVSAIHNQLEDVFAAQERALQGSLSHSYGFLGRPAMIHSNLFADAPPEVAEWMAATSMDYIPSRSSLAGTPEGQWRSRQSSASKSTSSEPAEERIVVTAFSADPVRSTEYESFESRGATSPRLCSTKNATTVPEEQPLRPFGTSSIASTEEESEHAMSQFFDFTSGSEQSPKHFKSHGRSAVHV